MWKLSSKSQPEFRPRHEKAEIAQSQTTASGPEAAANANDAESDAVDASNAQDALAWLESATVAKAQAKQEAATKIISKGKVGKFAKIARE